jgi:hypothetical protein
MILRNEYREMEDLNKLNSMTKYPSILTFHKMGERGRLKNEVQVPFEGPAILTEKVNGTNGRIILWPDGFYIIGSRDELLYAKGDLVGNPSLGIVNALKPIAENMVSSNTLRVYYLEVYGGNIDGFKQYTGNKNVGCRLFDVAMIQNKDEIMEMTVEKIASWRDHGGQHFANEDSLKNIKLPITPRIGVEVIPTDLKETYEWMKTKIADTQVKLDSGALGRPEGIVARTIDRSTIAKLRFEDYERTLR